MKKNYSKFYVLIALILIMGLSAYKYFFKSWSSYYQEKLYKEPRPLLIQVLKIYDHYPHAEKKALDLGAGVGNDTAFLLKNGWSVWANDKESEALKILSTRKDIELYKDKLTLVEGSFTDIAWQTLPQFNLIYASYSLPFLTRDDFLQVWKHIITALESGGILAVHFFGSGHGGFNAWEKRGMNFFTKEEIQALLKD